MKSFRNILQVVAIVSILPFIWALYSLLTGFEVVGLVQKGIVLLWGVIGFFISLISVYLLIKIEKQLELPANSWLYLLLQIYITIALILIILGIMLFIVLLLINAGGGFPL